MVYSLYKVSAPGSLMLCGEHAVLNGKHALVCAINKRITVTLKPRKDNIIHILSDIGELNTTIEKINIENPFEFVLATIQQEKNSLPSGFDLIIETEFQKNLGLGSSAAVTTATYGALYNWLNKKKPSSKLLHAISKKIIKKIQTIGSGADLAASIFGGVIAYRNDPIKIDKIPCELPPITVIYSGNKVTTEKVINIVKSNQEQNSKIFTSLYDAIDECTLKAIDSLKIKNWKNLGKIFNIHQGLQDSLGVNTQILSKLIFILREQKNIYGAKISGSGLGDCIIGIGTTDNKNLLQNELANISPKIQHIVNIDISNNGIQYLNE